ncbi:hypothetical protein JCM1393_20290 [Clostridium carnis]
MKKIKSIFRKLAKKLHPDINKNLDEEMFDLWIKVQEAYENNDLISLIILEGIANNEEINEDIKVNDIENNIKSLKIKIEEIKNTIDNDVKEFPLNIEELIYDEEYINSRKQELTNDIKEYEDISSIS